MKTNPKLSRKEASLDYIKKYIYMRINDPKTSPTAICRAYEALSGNIVSSESESSRQKHHTVNILFSNKKGYNTV
jgi:hypothetical protein